MVEWNRMKNWKFLLQHMRNFWIWASASIWDKKGRNHKPVQLATPLFQEMRHLPQHHTFAIHSTWGACEERWMDKSIIYYDVDSSEVENTQHEASYHHLRWTSKGVSRHAAGTAQLYELFISGWGNTKWCKFKPSAVHWYPVSYQGEVIISMTAEWGFR